MVEKKPPALPLNFISTGLHTMERWAMTVMGYEI